MSAQYSKLAAALAAITSRVRTDVTAVKGADGRQAWTRDPLTADAVARHLNGGPARGVCPIKEGESVTMVGLLDLDSHGGETDWDTMACVGGRVVDTLELLGGVPIAFKSSGGRGIHIYLLWDDPQDAYSVRVWLRDALAGCGLRAGVKGVASGEVEVFPKQDAVPAGGFGSQFILPLAGASVPLELCEMSGALVECSGGREAVIGRRWGMSDPVPVVAKPERGVVAVAGGAGLSAELLDALATLNVPGAELDYDEWRNVVFALHHETGGSDEGLALAHELSARSGKYNPDFLDSRVWPFITSDRDSAITGRSVLAMARARGWQDLSSVGAVAVFQPVVAPAAAPGAPAGPPAFTRNRAGKIEPTVTNAILAMERPDIIGFRVGYDAFRDELMVAAPEGPPDDGWRPVQDADVTEMRKALERAGFAAAPKELARDVLAKVASDHRFDSAQMWLGRQVWDGVQRVDSFLIDRFGVVDSEYARACSRYLWTAFAGRVLDPGCQVDMIVTLSGEQGEGKSRAVAAMVPAPEFAVEVDFSAREEDVARSMRGVLVGEVAELRGLRSKDAEGIKKFITRKWEKWVPKYKEYATVFPRRSVFVGTVNPDSIGFLGDETGERRWLPVDVRAVDVEGVARDREQLWAEGAVMWRAGGVAWREAERLAKDVHVQYTIEDMWQDGVCRWLDGVDGLAEGEGGVSGAVSRGQVAGGFTLEALAIGIGLTKRELHMGSQKRLGAILARLGYQKRQTRIDGRRAWRWKHRDAWSLPALD